MQGKMGYLGTKCLELKQRRWATWELRMHRSFREKGWDITHIDLVV